MKIYLMTCKLFSVLLVLFLLTNLSLAADPPLFKPYSANPLLTGTKAPYSVFKVAPDEYRLQYLQMNSSGTYPKDFSIDLMQSSNGTFWNLSTENIYAVTGKTFNYSAAELKENGIYKSWISATNNVNIAYTQLFYAETESDDLTDTTYKSQGVVLTNDKPYDSRNISYPYVIKVGNMYYLYYEAISTIMTYRIGIATSTDGITWDKVKAIEELGHATKPIILYNNQDGFEMFYQDQNNKNAYATSLDGMNWSKIGNIDSLDGQIIGAEKDGGIYKVWYFRSSGSNFDLCMALSGPMSRKLMLFSIGLTYGKSDCASNPSDFTADAIDYYESFKCYSKHYGYDFMVVLFTKDSGQTSFCEIESEINNLQMGPNDIFVFAYSGHGGGNTIGGVKGKDATLPGCCYLKNRDLTNALRKMASNDTRIIIILDACESHVFAETLTPGDLNKKSRVFVATSKENPETHSYKFPRRGLLSDRYCRSLRKELNCSSISMSQAFEIGNMGGFPDFDWLLFYDQLKRKSNVDDLIGQTVYNKNDETPTIMTYEMWNPQLIALSYLYLPLILSH
jgi:hypothetical protein